MNITEVRIKLMDEPGERLKAFCSITFDDCFVIRDLKIIEGASGPFVAMPSRKLTAHCGKCGMKNHLRASFCNQCGAKLEEGRIIKDADGRTKLYADIAHPINSRCREMIQQCVVTEYHEELERAKSPDYVSRYNDYDDGDFTESDTQDFPVRRTDAAHESNASNRPHHPPQGNPTTGASPSSSPKSGSTSGARHTPPTSGGGALPTSSPADRATGSDTSSFGAGIL